MTVKHHHCSWIIPAVLTLLLPIATIFCIGLWWQTGFSWEAEPPPWYCAPLYFLAAAMIIATPISFIWTIIAFIRWRQRPEDNGDSDKPLST